MDAFAWTDEKMATLTRMCVEGYSYRAIASHLGTTRNACLGKADRIGISVAARRRQYIYRLDDDHVPVVEIAARLLVRAEAVRLILEGRDRERRESSIEAARQRKLLIKRQNRRELMARRRAEREERERLKESARLAGTAPKDSLQAALDRAEMLAAGRSSVALFAANRLHLYDLKKAGYRAIDTECEGERDVLPIVIPRPLYAASYCGSPAASCAGL